MIRQLITVLVFCFSIVSTHAQTNEITEQYIKSFCGIAVEEMQRTGVPAAIKLAQGILETMSGQSPLVLKSNNHFGIKCKQGYEGPYVLHDDDRPQERFMKYESAHQSYRDHSDFLRGRSRYAALFTLDPTDYTGWAHGLKKAGYATNPRYPQILIGLVEKYQLMNYTLMGLGKLELSEDVKTYFAQKSGATPEIVAQNTATPEKPKNVYPEGSFLINNTKVVYLQPGASIKDVAQHYNIPVNRLQDMNDYSLPLDVASKGTLVYLQLKRTISDKSHHEVVAGENIFDIAQTEGIRLESLLKYNNLTKYSVITPGAKLKLRDDAASVATHTPTSTSTL